MSIKKILVVAGVSALTATVAVSGVSAADLAAPIAPVAVYAGLDYAVATNDWTGFYVGGHVGGLTTNDFTEANSRWAGGIQAGYLQQNGAFVFGAELDGTLTDKLYYELAPGAGLTLDWAVSAKARAGVALDQTLLYGVAGASLTEFSPAGAADSAAVTHVGAVFGAGIEQGIGNGFSLRAEYLQTRNFGVESSIGGAPRTDDLTNHAIMAGVNYRF